MRTTIDVRAPSDQSEGTRSQVSRWLKAVGEPVAENEPLIEVETDKVMIEIPAPAPGVLQEILKQESEEFAPGELLARIAVPETAQAAAHAMAQGAADSTADTGEADRESQAQAQRQPQPAAAERRPAQAAGSSTAAEALSAHAAAMAARRLSPAVRRLLAERGLQPADVRGTGEGGRITAGDVLSHTPATVSELRADSAPHTPPGTPGPAGRHIPHSTMRRRIAERMVESLLHTAPHVTTIFEADLGAVLAHRARHRAEYEQRGAALTLTAYFLAACVDAIRDVPEANSRWSADALELYDTIDIGVGTALEGKGLVVPVVRNVQSLDLFAIARELGELVSRARADKLTVADVRGGTFTISNHGVSGSLVAAPIIINQPQSAILGVGKLEKRAVVVTEAGEERIVIRPRCYVTLTIDHRVMDGNRANRFLEVLVGRLERWSD